MANLEMSISGKETHSCYQETRRIVLSDLPIHLGWSWSGKDQRVAWIDCGGIVQKALIQSRLSSTRNPSIAPTWAPS